MLTMQKIKDVLTCIVDTKTNKGILSLNLVKNIQISEGDITFDIEPDPNLTRTVKQALERLPGATSVTPRMIERVEPTRTPASNPLPGIESVIAVSSCKGGVGKSTLTVHLAQDLARRGLRVGLVDADIYGPSIPTLFYLQDVEVRTNAANKLIPIEKNNIKIMSFGFLLGNKPAVMRGPIVTRYVQQILLGTDWGELDYLLIDMPPGTGDVHLTITQTARLRGAVILTTPHTLSLIDVARGILMFEKVNVPILGVIENMSYFAPENTDEKHYVFGQKGAEQLHRQFGINILGEIPILPQLAQVADLPSSNAYITDVTDRLIEESKSDKVRTDIPEIIHDDNNITLTWPDGQKAIVSNFDLRLNSQDALSVNEVTGEKILKSKDIRPNIKAQKVIPLGNYAIGIEWNDGHTAGIYPYTLIKQLAGLEKG